MRKITIKIVESVSDSAKEIVKQVEREARMRGIAISSRDYDIVVAVGGDGTMIHAAALGHPMMAIKAGRRNHLLDVPPEKIGRAFDRLLKGDYKKSIYTLLEVRWAKKSALAFNEVGLVSVQPQTIITRVLYEDIKMEVEGDGVLIATAQGSTGWALSADEVYVDRRIECMVVALLNPVLMPIKALVIPQTQVSMELLSKGYQENAELAVDGKVRARLKIGDKVVVRKSPHSAVVYRFFKREPVRTLLQGSKGL